MSVRSILDIALHVENFRNIDLFFQGLYFLKFRVYVENKGQKMKAHPYIITENYKPYPQETNNSIKNSKFADNQIFRNSSIIEKTSEFQSKSFFIKFCEEEVELNDICQFRIEFPCEKDYEKQEIMVECDLGYHDCSQQNSMNVNQNKKSDDSEENQQSDFQIKATTKFLIRDAFSGIHEFVPVLFEDQNFCVVNLMVHTILLDHRYRISQIQLSEFAQIKPEERLNQLENNKQNFNENSVLSIYGYFQKQFKDIDFEKIYKLLVDSLKKSYETLYNNYIYMHSKCILEKQKKAFKKYLQPPMKLIIPEYMTNQNMSDQKLSKDINSKLADRFRTNDPDLIAHSIMNEANLISGQLFQLWHKYLDLYKISPRFCSALLHHQHLIKYRERWNLYMEKQQLKINSNISFNQSPNILTQHEQIATKMRSTIMKSKIYTEFKIEPVNFFPKGEEAPILFQESCQKEIIDKNEENILDIDSCTIDEENNYYKGIHLFVLVHGFQGNSFDMKLIKNYLNYMHPESMFLCSQANEENTEGDIRDMGFKLSQEVQVFIQENCPSNTLGRISFIGHSLGGIIIRAALDHLKEYSDKMYTYMSLSSPHLGFLYNSSKIIDAGIWLLKKLKKSESLKQLSMSDHSDLRKTFLFELSKKQGLSWFKNVCLCSSQQDNYGPFESTRIEIGKNWVNDDKGSVYKEMSQSIISNLQSTQLHRINVNFHIPDRNIDTFIGRTAHIMFLECQPLIRMIIYNLDNFFE